MQLHCNHTHNHNDTIFTCAPPHSDKVIKLIIDMNRARSTSERFMEPTKTGTRGSSLDPAATKPPAPSSKPAKEIGGVAPEEYDRLLGKITEEISDGDVWLTFPEGGRDAVEITSNDMGSVQPGAFLSGNVIDFYIKYLWDGLSCHMHKDHLHFFNSFFFTQLADSGSASTESEQRKSAFEKVQKWTGGVNIFEKSYVFIPVNQSYHWSLIIICHLSSLTGSPGKNDGPPCILHLDSIDGKHGSLESHVRSYIIHAWKERYHDPSVDQLLALSQMKYAEVKVPQQDNHYDCGIYMLHFVELFLVESIGGFGAVPMQGSLFSALWDASEVTSKRRDIRNLILELSLASRRKSRQHQKMISRLLQLMPVSQLSEVFETRLDNNGRVQEPQNDDGKHSNGGVCKQTVLEGEQQQQQQQQQQQEEVDCEEVELEVVKLKEVKRLQVECEEVKILEEDEEVDCEEVECEEVKGEEEPKGEVKVRRKRKRNWVWSKDETTVLLECRRIGGRFCRTRKQNVRTDWIAISKEIETKLGTAPSGNQCRLRYAVLLKAYKAAKSYCMSTNQKFAEKLFPGEVKLATHLTEAWYNTIDEICRNAHQFERYPKRVKFSPTVYAPEKGADHPCTENKCAEPRQGSQTTDDTMVDSETPESPTRDDDPCSQQRALEYLRAFLRSESQKEPEIR